MNHKCILGIESSCDDTGIALIKGKEIIQNIVLKQEHKKGVIPEYAARAHHVALFESAKSIIAGNKVDAIAYTHGPGLIGSLFVGASFAKGLACSLQVPIVGVNHLHGHILIPLWLYEEKLSVPYLCLLVSGGHTMIVLVEKINGKFKYEVLSSTLDDAVGEMLDKVARNIGLDYPGGPYIEKLAAKYNYSSDHDNKFSFPYAMKNRDDFSFSGIKTAAIEQISINSTEEEKIEFCYLLQKHVALLLSDKLKQVFSKLSDKKIMHWVVSGGVAANKTIRAKIEQTAREVGVEAIFPPIELCTDNGVMIAAAASLQDEFHSPFSDKAAGAKPSAQMDLNF